MGSVGLRLRMGVCALVVFCLAGFASAAIKEVAYVESTGAQWINTHYVPTCTDTFEMKVRFSALGFNQGLWCARGSDTAKNTMTCFAWQSDNKLRLDRNTNTGTYSPNNSIGTTDDHVIVANYSTLKATIDGGSETTMASGDFTCGGVLTLFASHQAYASFGNFSKVKLYSFKITDKDGNVVREFVPAKDTVKNEFGLFEKQQKLFFPGLGASPLTGPEVAAEATEFTEEGIGWNVINVEANQTKTLTAADVAAFDAAKPLVKLGPGTVSAGAEMENFAGDILIRDGVYKATNKASFGTSAGKTYVDGGTLQSTVGASTTWTSSGGNAAYGEERFYLNIQPHVIRCGCVPIAEFLSVGNLDGAAVLQKLGTQRGIGRQQGIQRRLHHVVGLLRFSGQRAVLPAVAEQRHLAAVPRPHLVGMGEDIGTETAVRRPAALTEEAEPQPVTLRIGLKEGAAERVCRAELRLHMLHRPFHERGLFLPAQAGDAHHPPLPVGAQQLGVGGIRRGCIGIGIQAEELGMEDVADARGVEHLDAVALAPVEKVGDVLRSDFIQARLDAAA